MGGDDDDRQVRIEDSQALEHLVAAKVGHPHVQHDRVRSAAGRHFQTGSSSFGFSDLEPGVRQDIPHDPAHILIIIDNQDHGLLAHQNGLRNHPNQSGRRGAGSSRDGVKPANRHAAQRAPARGGLRAARFEPDPVLASAATRAASTRTSSRRVKKWRPCRTRHHA